MEPHDEQMARTLSQEVNYSYSSFTERLKNQCITNLQSAIKNDVEHANATLIVASSIRQTLEADVFRGIANELEQFGIET